MDEKEFNKDSKQETDSGNIEKLLENLALNEDEFEEVLDQPPDNSSDEITVGTTETEIALSQVNHQLGFDKKIHGFEKSQRKNLLYKYLAAAVVLLALTVGWFLFPRTAEAPYGEMVLVSLPDGSQVELNSGTELKYNLLFGTMHRNVELDGEAYFIVESASQPFTVEANGTVTEVTGTEFNIRSWDKDPGSVTTITVAEGEVIFYTESNFDDRKTLSSGLSSFWSADAEELSEPDSVNINSALAWRNDNLSFVNQPLQVIFNELERKFDIHIEIENDEIRRETLTTFYTRPENLEMLLNDITTVKGLQYRETSSGYYVFNRK